MGASLVPTVAASAASLPVINTYTAMSGVASHVAAKGTLAFTMTFVQHSSYQLYLAGLSFEIWNDCLCAPDDPATTSATYLDPSTHTWRSTGHAEGNAYGLWLNEYQVLRSGETVQIPVRLNVARFRPGRYTIADNGTTVGNALDAAGNDVKFTWRVHEAGNRHLTIGATGPAPTPTRSRSVGSTTPTRPVAAPVVTSAAVAPAPTTVALPSATPTTLPAGTVRPPALASQPHTPASRWPVWWLLAGIAAAGAAATFVWWRVIAVPRSRDPAPAETYVA